jgi:hypothetical protein
MVQPCNEQDAPAMDNSTNLKVLDVQPGNDILVPAAAVVVGKPEVGLRARVLCSVQCQDGLAGYRVMAAPGDVVLVRDIKQKLACIKVGLRWYRLISCSVTNWLHPITK